MDHDTFAGTVADRATQIHGGSGYVPEVAVERLHRDARLLLRIYESTSRIQQPSIARGAHVCPPRRGRP